MHIYLYNYYMMIILYNSVIQWCLVLFLAVQLQQRGYYTQLQSLVETMYIDSNERVTMVAHSAGGLVSLYFLNNAVNQEWKDQYINAYIPIAAPVGGTFFSLSTIILGNSSIQPFAGGRDSSATTRSFPSISSLIPCPSVWDDTVIISTSSRNFTAGDYQEIYEAIGDTNGYRMYLDTADVCKTYSAPNVTVHCVIIPTLNRLGYSTDSISNSSPAEFRNGVGDGLTEIRSTEVCLKWQNKQDKGFSYQKIPGGQHIQLLNNFNVLQVSRKQLSNKLMYTCA